MYTYRRKIAIAATAIALTAPAAGCAATAAPTTTAAPISTSASPTLTSSLSGSSAHSSAKLPACSTLKSVLVQHFPNAVLAADHPPQVLPGAGYQQQCNATAPLSQAGGLPLPISIELGRIDQAADGQPAEQRVLAEVPRQVTNMCPASTPPISDPGPPHSWTCAGPDDEITPVAGVADNGDYVIVSLVGFAATTPAVHDRMAENTTQLAHDVLKLASQT
jgi:hypothetical protein